MSRSIDERIVNMQFNNKQFEEGIKDSLDSLDKLKAGLDIDDAGKLNLSGLTTGVNEISNKFSSLEEIGIGALRRIGELIVDISGKVVELVKSFTLDPITEGWSKYEIQVQSVQAIMNATGQDIDTVSEQMDRLRAYTDETSFSMVDMTTNIAKFTGAGVALDDAVTSMQGIGNYAALSGLSIEQTSSAMGVFAKAIGQGAMQLQEWRQIENMSGATMEFKQQLLDAGVAAGTLTKELDGTYTATYFDSFSGKAKEATVTLTNFTEGMTKSGWLNKEVMTSTLNEYGRVSAAVLQLLETDQAKTAREAIQMIEDLNDPIFELGLKAFKAAQETKTLTDALNYVKDAVSSGWAYTWELLFGNFEEARIFFSELTEVLYDIFVAAGDARNELLSVWRDEGGRSLFINALLNLANSVSMIVEQISTAFHNIFPPMTVDTLMEITKAFQEFSENLVYTIEESDTLERIFTGLFAAIGIVIDVFEFLFAVLGRVLGALSPVGGAIIELIVKFADFVTAVKQSGSVAEFFESALAGIDTAIEWLATNIPKAFNAVVEAVSNFASDVNEKFQSISGVSLLEAFQSVVGTISGIIDWISDKVSTGLGIVADYFSKFSGIDLGPLRIFSGEVETQFRPFTFVADVFRSMIDGIVAAWNLAQPYLEKIAEFFGPILSAIGNAIKGFASSLGINSLADLFDMAVITTIVLTLKKFFDTLTGIFSEASGFVENINSVLEGVSGALEAFQSKLKADALLSISIAIGVLVASLLVLSTIDVEKLGPALLAITILFADLAATLAALSKVMGPIKLGGVATAMIEVSVAILLLSVAMKNLAELKPEEIGQGLIAITVLMTELAGFTKLVDGSKLATIGVGLIGVAMAILILSEAIKNLAELDWEKLAKGLVGVGVLLAELGGFTKLVDSTSMLAAGAAMIPLAAGILILSQAVKSISELSWEELAIGLLGLAGALGAVVAATKLMDPVELLAMGVSMVGIGAGLIAISAAMTIISNLSWEELGKGLLGVGASLLIIAAATNLMDPAEMLALGVSLVGVGAGLVIIAGAMVIMGGMSWEEIAKSLIMLAGSMTILSVAAKALGVEGIAGAAAILVMSAALAVLTPSLVILGSMDLENIGSALLMIAGVFVIFGAAGLILGPVAPVLIALSAALVLLGVGMAGIGIGLLAVSAAMTTFAAAGAIGVAALVSVIEAILGTIPMAIEKVGEGLLLLLQLIADSMPLIMEALTEIIKGLIQVLVDLAPDLVEAVFIFLGKVLDTLVEHVPEFVQAGFELLIGIMTGIRDNIGEITTLTIEIIAEFLKGLADGIPEFAKSAADLITAFMAAIGEETPRIIDAGYKMIIDFVNGLADAIRDNAGDLVESFMNLGSAIVEGIIDGMFAGIKGIGKSIVNIGSRIIDGFKDFFIIESPSQKTRDEIGKMIPAGIEEGIEDGTPAAVKAATNMGDALLFGSTEWMDQYASKTKDVTSDTNAMFEETAKQREAREKAEKKAAAEAKREAEKARKEEEEARKKAYEADLKRIEELKVANISSVLEEIAMFDELTLKYGEGTKEREDIRKNLAELYEKLDKEQYQLHNTLMDEQFVKDKIDLERKRDLIKLHIDDEIAMWEELGGQYDELSRERILTDIRIAELRKKQLDEHADLRKEDFEVEMRFIEARKKETNATIAEEIEMYKEASERFEEHSTEKIAILEKAGELEKQHTKELAAEQLILKSQAAKQMFEEDKAHIEESVALIKIGEAEKLYILQEASKLNTEEGRARIAEGKKAIKEEIAMWEEAAKKYDETSQERIKIDIIIAERRKELLNFEIAELIANNKLKLDDAENYKVQMLALDEELASLQIKLAEEQARELEAVKEASFIVDKAYLKRTLELQKASLEDQIKALKEFGDKYEENSKHRIDIEMEIADRQQELLKREADERKRQFEIEKEYIKRKKDLVGLSLQEEIDMWKEASQLFESYSDERKEIDKIIFDLEVKNIKERRTLQKTSLEEELAELTALRDNYALGSEERKQAEQEMLNAIKERRQENLITSTEELAALETLMTQYREGSEERKLIETEIADVKKQIAKEEYDAMVERRKLGEMTLIEEYAMWAEAQAKYAEGTEERMRIEKELADTRKRIAEEEKKIREEIDKLEEDYVNAVEQRTQQLANSFGLFAEVKEKELVEGQKLIDNLRDQVEEMRSWATNIEELARRGVDEGLLEELRKMGPGANAEIDALTRMTDTELSFYSQLWRTKMNLARTMAIEELAPLKAETDAKISELQASLEALEITDFSKLAESGQEAANTYLDNFTDTAETKAPDATQKVSDATKDGLESNKDIYSQLGEQYGTDFAKGFEDTKDTAKDAGTTITKSVEDVIRDDIKAYKPLGEEGGSDFADGISSNEDKANDSGRTIAQAAYDAMKQITDRFQELGSNAGNSFASGISSTMWAVQSAAEAIAQVARSTIEAALVIHSPSKVMTKLGNWTTRGFANGILELVGLVEDSSTEITDSAIDGMSNAIVEMSDLLDTDIDMNPTITPVLDLSGVERGVQYLNRNLASRSFNLAGRVSDNQNGSSSTSDGSNATPTGEMSIINKFEIASLVVREEADIEKIARDLHKLQKKTSRINEVRVGR